MTIPTFIEKPRISVAPTNYDNLRAEGIEHISKLSSKIWTDHNAHDPGITSLEVLSYALTDLSYRTQFPTVDLLTKEDGSIGLPEQTGLFPAQDILTTGPRTISDYRRLLMRIDGVRNVWLDPMNDPSRPENYRQSEVPLHADCDAGALKIVGPKDEVHHPIQISGLYKLRVDLEEDDLLGSLNDPGAITPLLRGPLKGVLVRINYAIAPKVEYALLQKQVKAVSIDALKGNPIQGYLATATLEFKKSRKKLKLELDIDVINDKPRVDQPAPEITIKDLKTELSRFRDVAPIPVFWAKQGKIARSLSAIQAAYLAHRGLCEDMLDIDTVDQQKIGICADIELTKEADIELVQAQVYRAIDRYMAPPVRFQTLDEMLENGHAPDEIFNAPYVDFKLEYDGKPLFSKPGFLPESELEKSALRTSVHASDIISLIMEIEGVVAVRDLHLRGYDADGIGLDDEHAWSLDIENGQAPNFYIHGTKLLFLKNGIPYRAQPTEMERTLHFLRQSEKRDVYVDPNQVLETPKGRFRNLAKHYPVQNDFPQTYMIGTAGISERESQGRIAAARQFKGYLTVFDQFLADYLGQLANLRDLYGIDGLEQRTWASQYLHDIPGSRGAFEDEFYVDADALANDANRDRLSESDATSLARENRLLDHLISRFAESFTDYALVNLKITDDSMRTQQEAAADKRQFLKDYPELSRDRGQGVDLLVDENAIWDADSISGYQRRVCRILGIDNPNRRDLASDQHMIEFLKVDADGSFTVEGPEGVLFKPQNLPKNEAAREKILLEFYYTMRQEHVLQVDRSGGTGRFKIFANLSTGPLVHSERFDEEQDAVQAIRALIDHYDMLLEGPLCNDEGMHVFEHILLRPKDHRDAVIQTCLDEDCDFSGEEDPYSFRLSVVMPYWPERFQSQHFRRHAEHVLREEAPAHVHVRVCWIGLDQMRMLDHDARAFFTSLASITPASNRSSVLGDLIETLSDLKTVYPNATLHDCDEGEDENVIQLGSSALGIF